MKMDLVVSGYIIHNQKVLLIHHRKSGLWLPPGGHMDLHETPDSALVREIKEELNLDIEIIGSGEVPMEGNIKQQLATPFHVNVHSAGDHDHCCFFYICKPKNLGSLSPDSREIVSHEWYSKEDLESSHIPSDVKNIGLKAFDILDNHSMSV